MTGLKTGSTSLAKYCLSATGRKDGVDLIAVVLAAPDYKARFADAVSLLNYGFGACRLYRDEAMPQLPSLAVTGGVEREVPLAYAGEFTYLGLHGEDFSGVEKELSLPESIPAPVEQGTPVGVLKYTLNGTPLGEVQILAGGSVEKAGYLDYLKDAAGRCFFGSCKPEQTVVQ